VKSTAPAARPSRPYVARLVVGTIKKIVFRAFVIFVVRRLQMPLLLKLTSYAEV
jgi:hypothetical protein